MFGRIATAAGVLGADMGIGEQSTCPNGIWGSVPNVVPLATAIYIDSQRHIPPTLKGEGWGKRPQFRCSSPQNEKVTMTADLQGSNSPSQFV